MLKRRSFSKYLIALFFLLSSGLKVQAQEDDFLLLLNDSAASSDFLLPQRPGRYLPYAENEQVNLKRFQSATEKNNDRLLSVAVNNLGMIYLKNGDPLKALTFFKKAEEAAIRMKSDKALSTALIEQGISSQQIKDYSKAIEYYNRASSLLNKMKLPKVSGLVYNLTAQCYTHQRDYASAVEFFTVAAKSYSSAGIKIQTATCMNSAGELQLRLEDYKKAQDNFNSAIALLSSKDKTLLPVVLRNLGLVEFKRGQFEKAIEYFNRSLAINNQLILHKLIKDACMQLFTFYSYKNDFVKADFFHDKYRGLKDSLDIVDEKARGSRVNITMEAEKQQVIELLQKQYQLQSEAMNQRQLELSQMITKTDIELQNKDQQLVQKDSVVQQLTNEKIKRERDLAQKELQLSRQKNFRNLLIAIAIATLLVSLLLFNLYKTKKKANSQLEEAYDQLKQAQNRLIQSEKMASLGQLTAGIAHEIQNPLNFVNNFSESAQDIFKEYVSEQDLDEKNKLEQELQQTLEKIHHHGERADQIVKGMLLHSRAHSGETVNVDLNEICKEYIQLAYKGYRTGNLLFECKIKEDYSEDLFPVKSNMQDLGRVMLNLCGNALYALGKKKLALQQLNRASGYEPQLSIRTFNDKHSVCVELNDNGTGVPKEIIAKIFDPFFTTKPTGEGTGLGLSISYDIIKSIGGELSVISEENNFTTFTLKFPAASKN